MASDETQQKKFYNLSPAERLERLADERGISAADSAALAGEQGLTHESADRMIENVIGTFSLPLGIARHFVVNGR